jgi:hypothetical protein
MRTIGNSKAIGKKGVKKGIEAVKFPGAMASTAVKSQTRLKLNGFDPFF